LSKKEVKRPDYFWRQPARAARDSHWVWSGGDAGGEYDGGAWEVAGRAQRVVKRRRRRRKSMVVGRVRYIVDGSRPVGCCREKGVLGRRRMRRERSDGAILFGEADSYAN
jgi:hypothetical protein